MKDLKRRRLIGWSAAALSAPLFAQQDHAGHAPPPEAGPASKKKPRPQLGMGAALGPDGRPRVVRLVDGRLVTQVHQGDKGWATPRVLDIGADQLQADGENSPKLAFGPGGVAVISYTQALSKPFTGAIRLLRSSDGGANFAPPITVHQDRQEITHQLSERHACRLVGLSRDAYRHPPAVSPENQMLSERIKAVALVRRRFGYRRVHDVLRADFPGVNHKRVYRLYKAADLAVRKRKKAKRPLGQRTPLVAANTVNGVWSMDFVSDSLCNARRIKCLAVADDFSHECVQMAVDFGISGQYVTRLLDEAAQFRGYPRAVRTDNGPEFTSRAFLGWCERNKIQHILIEPGRPMQNGYIESFNGKFRDECLNEHWFETLAQAREVIRAWVQDYNEVRPHSSIGRMPPRRFARLHRQQAGDAGSAQNQPANKVTLQPRTLSE